ncbi:CRAL-TRIO domain-containing protein [Podospora didyma]|uniref:CRAL-TRIO domain-containing protein n=1 Tax=Podospora didyma TaxID=330526 RepID=A0AAE0U394_9PEZI|nr:CRAL-TRIO domain-containing protein [Podospora didyma]
MTGSTLTATTSATTGVSAAGHEIGYPHGHLGCLSSEEEEALRSFKVFAEEKAAYRAGPSPSHDDQTLLYVRPLHSPGICRGILTLTNQPTNRRYLRARRWNIQDAYVQFKETEDWRKANQLDVLYDTIEVEPYEQARALYPRWTGRRDRRGIPLYVYEIRHLDSKTVAAYEKSAAESTDSKAKTDGTTPNKLLRLFALYENLTRFAQPMCTELPDREHAHVPITLSTNIVDVTGVSLRMFWNLKSHMQAASQLATAHYPETLDRIFIIGAPYFFSTVWGWIKRWFDPVTVSKIFILSAAEVKPTLEEFIDPKNIPKQYGGELEFLFHDRPNLDPYVRDRATWLNGHTDFPDGPLYWVPVDDGKAAIECIAIGSVNKTERRERVCTLPRAFPSKQAETAPAAAAATTTTTEADLQAGVQSLAIADEKPVSKDAAEISEKVPEAEAAKTATVSA